jgi:Ser/Thr protein kinase RdoA (MazF antagonist)
MNSRLGTEEEIPLDGGGRTIVARRGDIVLRETGPWANSVHAFLKHLEGHGFEGAPRVMGSGFDDKGRETLTYVEGQVVHPTLWPEVALISMGVLLRRLHNAAKSFCPPANAIWRPWFGRHIGTPDIIGHCDISPWNVVLRNSKAYALIDWEAAGPTNRLTEVALAAWTCAQLYDDDIAERNNLPDAGTRIMLVRRFVDAYELSISERHLLADRMIELAICSAAAECMEYRITPDITQTPGLWGIVWRARSAAWLIRNRQMIEAALR